MTEKAAGDLRPWRPRASLSQAMQRFVDATQRLAADRTDLLKLEAGEELREGAMWLLRIVAGAVPVTAGWALLVAAFVTWLSRRVAPEVALATVGAGHALIGLVLLSREWKGR